MDLIECKKLTIGYSDKIVYKDITFSVQKGEYLCIVGENGCGKSTLLKTLLGLNKPIKGKIVFNKEFNKSFIGYLPQQLDSQRDFPATVREIIMSGFINKMKWRPFYNKQEKEKANKLMQNLGILDLQKKSLKELSGGQQQRVLLARALCSTDELLVLDEPTNGLDAKSTKSLYELIYKLNKENGITIIMVSHNTDKVLSYASNILYLKKDKYFAGTKQEFMESEYLSLLQPEGVRK